MKNNFKHLNYLFLLKNYTVNQKLQREIICLAVYGACTNFQTDRYGTSRETKNEFLRKWVDRIKQFFFLNYLQDQGHISTLE